MRRFANIFVNCVSFFVILITGTVNPENNRLHLSKLHGNWEGEGTYYLPFTNIPTTIEGVGEFKYDSTTRILHTRFSAERFMIKYSDSGKMAYLHNKDSLKWDIWNSFGYYVQYRGNVDGNTIHGRQRTGKFLYDMYIDLVSEDSISIRVNTTDNDGESSERVTGYLKRKKKIAGQKE